ncbi:MAG: hypothetical protein QOI49_2635 [Verrucomicrobiota bacterium]
MAKQSQHSRPSRKVYVVGHRSGEFCALVPEIGGEAADDQNLESAWHFHSLREAIRISGERSCSVFEIVNESGQETLRELKVDLSLIAKVPYEGCYFIRRFLLAGPTFTGLSTEVTTTRIAALAHAGVGVVVSACSRGEMFQVDEITHKLDLYELFDHHVFPILDGGVPSKGIMRTILDTVDASLDKGLIVFVHCVGGRGRTGLVIGCWIARHGIAVGESVLEELAHVRYKHGLFKPSPETEKQCRFVIEWEQGE